MVSDNSIIASGTEFEKMPNYIVTRSWIKSGPRNDTLQHLKWGDYFKALQKGPAAYPHHPVHHDPDVNAQNPQVHFFFIIM